MKIDLHVHCSERSPCAKSTEEEQVRAAIAAGLDAVVFTDHHRLVPQDRLEALNRQFAPFCIFGGVEITADGEDCLVYGFRHPSLEQTGWKYPDLYAFVRQQGGMIALAHPFRYAPQIRVDVQRYLPDAIEGRSVNILADNESRIQVLADKLGLPLLCNSDAHTSDRVGVYYNDLKGSPVNEMDVLAAVRAGRFSCGNGYH